ncbi:MAG: hypothetical protein JWN97_2175, partial [Nocardioides sp.]|nr:hypothetical protein [Nocardioides sp.]
TRDYKAMLGYVRQQWPHHRWAIEGAHGVGRPLAQRLLADSPAPASTHRSRQDGAPHRTNDLDGDKRRRTLTGAETPLLTQRGTEMD